MNAEQFIKAEQAKTDEEFFNTKERRTYLKNAFDSVSFGMKKTSADFQQALSDMVHKAVRNIVVCHDVNEKLGTEEYFLSLGHVTKENA